MNKKIIWHLNIDMVEKIIYENKTFNWQVLVNGQLKFRLCSGIFQYEK